MTTERDFGLDRADIAVADEIAQLATVALRVDGLPEADTLSDGLQATQYGARLAIHTLRGTGVLATESAPAFAEAVDRALDRTETEQGLPPRARLTKVDAEPEDGSDGITPGLIALDTSDIVGFPGNITTTPFTAERKGESSVKTEEELAEGERRLGILMDASDFFTNNLGRLQGMRPSERRAVIENAVLDIMDSTLGGNTRLGFSDRPQIKDNIDLGEG